MISICRGCGPGTLLEIERYATANGIDVGTHTEDVNSLERIGLSVRALNVMRDLTNSDIPTLDQLKGFIDEHADWHTKIFTMKDCGRKTMREIEVLAYECGLIPKMEYDRSALISRVQTAKRLDKSA